MVAFLQIAVFGICSYMLAQSELKVGQSRYSAMTANRAVALTRGIQEWASSMLLTAMSRKPEFKIRYKQLCAELPAEFENVEKQVSGNKEDAEDIEKARKGMLFLMTGIEEMRARLLESPDLANFIRAKQYVELSGSGHMRDSSDALARVVQRHRVRSSVLAQLERDRQEKFRLVLASGILLSLFSLTAIVLGFSRGINKRLTLINENFLRFRNNQPLHAPISGGDEICTLDNSFRELARELEEASEKDKAVFTHLPAGLITCYADGTIQSLNPSAERLLGITNESVTDKLIESLLDPDDHRVRDNETHLAPGKYRFLTANGYCCPVELTVSSFRLRETRMLLFAIVDISAKEEVERMKQEFLSIVSHDLQTPLTSIKLGISMLQEEEICQLTNESRRVLNVAGRETDRLVRLTKDLLDLSRAESGNIVLLKEPVSAAAIVEQAVGAVFQAAIQKSVRIIDKSIDLEIDVDPDRICQILVNFLSNAIKYSAPSTVVEVKVERVGKNVLFSVMDQGRGIPTDKIVQVFERFKQVYDADSSKGTGLGLAICKLLAEAHGGSVSVESELGKGSTFTLSIPVLHPVNLAEQTEIAQQT